MGFEDQVSTNRSVIGTLNALGRNMKYPEAAGSWFG